MEHNLNSSPEAATHEPAFSSSADPCSAAPDAPSAGPPGFDPHRRRFSNQAEADAYRAGVSQGLRALSGEAQRADGAPVAPRTAEEAAAAAFHPSGRRCRYDGWTPERKVAFLEHLAAGAVVADACRSVGLSVASAYALRNRRADLAFGEVWDAILVHRARARLGDDTMARAMNGCVEEIYRDGKLVGERRRHDNRLAMAVLARLDRLADQAEAGGRAETLRNLSLDFEEYLDCVEGGGDEQAFLDERSAAPAPAPSGSGEGVKLDLAALRALLGGLAPGGSGEEDDEAGTEEEPDEELVWQAKNGSWWTNFPPPEGFAGRERGVYDGRAYYERTLSEAEQATVDAELERIRDDDVAWRDRYFGFAADGAAYDPDCADGAADGFKQASTSSTSGRLPPRSERDGEPGEGEQAAGDGEA